MAYAKILAPLTGGARDAIVLASAFAAARPFNAHVVALFVRPDPTEAMPFFGEGVSGVVVQEVVDAANEAADKAVVETRTMLASSAAAAGVAQIPRPERKDTPSVSFHEVQGNFADRVADASKLSDLIVFGPLKANDKPGLTEAFEAVLLETGRPVLLTAQVAPRGFSKIAVGWDGGFTSAHALLAAMPYLAKAASVEILCVRRGDDAPSCHQPQEYLRLHGVEASERVVDAGGRSIGEVLLEAASQGGADLLVLGGYGHSRLRELFVGGVTKHVVSHAELPLLLVH